MIFERAYTPTLNLPPRILPIDIKLSTDVNIVTGRWSELEPDSTETDDITKFKTYITEDSKSRGETITLLVDATEIALQLRNSTHIWYLFIWLGDFNE
jgi:hypothetical protein